VTSTEGAEVILLDEVSRTFGDVVAVDGLTSPSVAARCSGCSATTAPARPRRSGWSRGCSRPPRAGCASTGSTRHATARRCAAGSGCSRRTAAVDDRLSGRDNLRFAADLYDLPRAGSERAIDEVLDRFGLTARQHERAGGYSTGMRQRLSLARVLLHDPDVLLLDEPTASLDPVAARQVRDLIADLGGRGDRTVVLCTHDLAEAQRLCDRVAILEHGRTIALGSPAELAEAWGAEVQVEVHPDDLGAALALEPVAGLAATREDDRHVRFPGIGRAEVPRLVHALSDAGIRVYGVDRREPSLEDVYLRLHRDETEEVAS
jgi:ABC-2 type transport system ATP-binding protein